MKKILLLGAIVAHLLANVVFGQSVTTIVGPQPSGGLLEPYAVAVDPQDNLYITDSANHRIVRFKPSTGEFTTFAGKLGEAGSANGSLAASRFFDPRGIIYARGGLVVADGGNHTLRYINLTNGTVTTLAGTPGKTGFQDGSAGSALFRNPRGLAIDALGSIYIADTRNKAVRKLDGADLVSTVTQNEILSPAGIATAENGDLFVSDRLDHTIKRVSQAGGVVTVSPLAGTSAASGTNDAPSGGAASFNVPEGLLWLGDSFGLLISDSENHTLRRARRDTNTTEWVVETYAGTPEAAGLTDGALSAARFNLPGGLVKYSTGFLIVDQGSGTVREILTSPAQPRIADPVIGNIIVVTDKDSGKSKTKLIPVTDETFNDGIVIGILAERGVRTLFTAGASRTNVFQPDPIPDPTAASNTAPDYQDGQDPDAVPPSLTIFQPDLTVKAVSMSEGRTSSRIVSANFHFQVATPSIDTSTPGFIMFKDLTSLCTLYYTLDGSEPTTSSLGPKNSGEKVPIILGKTNITVKVRGFRDNFKPSQIASVELSPDNFIPNRISFGFATGEASSDFVASAGQRFYAPVTLTTVSGQTMYGMQFNVTLENKGPSVTPNGAFQMSFQSMLQEKIVTGYRTIPNLAFEKIQTNVTTIGTGTNAFFVTNTIPVFTSLLFTNTTTNLLGVGWLERVGQSKLFDTVLQDLIKYSIAHDTVFDSANSRVVLGGFSFVVPPAVPTNQTYDIQIGRPSGTADGITTDVFIETPDGKDPRVPISARKTVTIGQRRYIVGDLAPFRWFNAGDFGDGSLLNNDMTQIFQTTAYFVNPPPTGSDMEDAIDSCCLTQSKTPLPAGVLFDGDDTTINQMAFGDGVLDVSDLFVSFRRSLDFTLTWYARYWSNGVREAVVVPNVFRPPGTQSAVAPLARQSVRRPSAPTGEPPFVAFSCDNVIAAAGQKVVIPVRAAITGGYPIRVMNLNIKVSPIDGAPALETGVRFVPSPLLGAPTLSSTNLSSFSSAWLDNTVQGVSGDGILGNIEIDVPQGASPNGAYFVDFQHISASPNGIGVFPKTARPGVVTLSGRTTAPFNDGIPDSWRLKYFNSLQNILSSAQADADGDGISNYDEYRTGTNPTDTTSQFKVSAAANSAAGTVKLRWPASAGRRYILERSTSVIDPVWTTVNSNLVAGADFVEYEDSGAVSATQFYRVRLAE